MNREKYYILITNLVKLSIVKNIVFDLVPGDHITDSDHQAMLQKLYQWMDAHFDALEEGNDEAT